MIEANVEIGEAREGDLKRAASKVAAIYRGFRRVRSDLARAGTTMTGPQKLAVLALLTEAKTARDAAIVLADEAFNATEPIDEGGE